MTETSRLVALAREALAAGDLPRAAAIAAQAATAEGGDRVALLRIRAQLGLIGHGTGPADYQGLAAEAETAAHSHPVEAGMVMADAAAIALYGGEVERTMSLLTRAGQLVGEDPAGQRHVAMWTGLVHSFRGEAEIAAPLLDRALEPLSDTASVSEATQAVQAVVLALAAAERYDSATLVSQRAVAAARRVGAPGVLPLLLCLLANSTYFLADFDTTLLAAGEAERLARGLDQPSIIVFSAACAALAHAARGNDAELRRWVAVGRTELSRSGMQIFAHTLSLAEALLALSVGDNAVAITLLDQVDRRLVDGGSATGVLQWRANWVEALHRGGRTEAARRALEEYATVVGDRPLPWSQAMLARTRGLLAETGWEGHFAHAVKSHPPELSRFELGRTHLCWAERAHASGLRDQAQRQAAEAAELFRSVDAAHWLARAEALVTAPPAAMTIEKKPDSVIVRGMGPCTVIRDGVEELVPVDAAGTVIRFLIAADGHATAEQVSEALWPEAVADRTPARLRNVLYRLRQRWGDLVVRDGHMLRFAPGVTLDSQEFTRLATTAIDSRDREAGQAAARWYRAELLPATRYADWAAAPRERLRRLYARMLVSLAEVAEAAGQVEAALENLQKAIELYPHDETYYVCAADLLLRAGRPGAARRIVEQALAVTRDELGLPPGAELRRVRDAISTTGYLAGPTASPH